MKCKMTHFLIMFISQYMIMALTNKPNYFSCPELHFKDLKIFSSCLPWTATDFRKHCTPVTSMKTILNCILWGSKKVFKSICLWFEVLLFLYSGVCLLTLVVVGRDDPLVVVTQSRAAWTRGWAERPGQSQRGVRWLKLNSAGTVITSATVTL